MADLSNQVPFQTPPPNLSVKPQKVNILSKIIGGLSWWIGSLTGHPQAKKINVNQASPSGRPQSIQSQQAAATGQPSQPATISDDPMTEDLEHLKKLVGKFSANVNKSVGPVVQKGIQSSAKKASTFGNSNKNFLRTVLKIFFIAVLVIVVIFIGMQFFKKLPGGNGGNSTPTPEENGATATPTPVVYNPTKPSIYANDPAVLKLEKDIDVLGREMSGTNIKETQLNPPSLDYSISF